MKNANSYFGPRAALGFCAIAFFLGTSAARAESAASLAETMENGFDYSEVLFPLRQALRENPNDARLHYQLGKLCLNEGSKLRAVKELQLALKLAPQAAFAGDCKEMLAAWEKKEKQYGDKAWSNFDFWFVDYYKTHEYKSSDPDAEPGWSKNRDKEREWKVDVQLMEYGARAGGANENERLSCFGKRAETLMKEVHDRFEAATAGQKLAGSADVYFYADAAGVVHPTIARLEGGEPLAGAIAKICASLKGKAGCNTTFKARLASKYAMYNSGTWYAFTARSFELPSGFSLDLNPSDSGGRASKQNTILIPGDICGPLAHVASKPSSAKSSPGGEKEVHASASGSSRAGLKLASGAPGREPAPQKTRARELSLDKSRQCLQKGDFNGAYAELWSLVKYDDPDAYLLMGKALSSENNPHPQPRVAELFFQRAAQKGNLEAIEQITDAVEFGNSQLGWPQAVVLLKEGSDRGSAKCQLSLGRHLEFGDGLPENKNLARQYYQMAAAKGDANARAALSRLAKQSR